MDLISKWITENYKELESYAKYSFSSKGYLWQDVLHDTFLYLMKNGDMFTRLIEDEDTEVGKCKFYAMRSIRNRCNTLHKSIRENMESIDGEYDLSDFLQKKEYDYLEEDTEYDNLEIIEEVLLGINPFDRECIRLNKAYQLSVDEILSYFSEYGLELKYSFVNTGIQFTLDAVRMKIMKGIDKNLEVRNLKVSSTVNVLSCAKIFEKIYKRIELDRINDNSVKKQKSYNTIYRESNIKNNTIETYELSERELELLKKIIVKTGKSGLTCKLYTDNIDVAKELSNIHNAKIVKKFDSYEIKVYKSAVIVAYKKFDVDLYERSNYNKNRISVNDGFKNKKIQQNELDKYINNGFKLGMIKLREPHAWITKDNENLQVPVKDIETYLQAGYKKGRYIDPEIGKKQSQTKKNKK